MYISSGQRSNPKTPEPVRKLKLEELGRQSIEDFRKNPGIPLVVVLDNVRSAMNVGSVFRTADAFAIEKIILCGITPTPPNREIAKTALGATESVNWEYSPEILTAVQKLKWEGYHITGIEQTDQSANLMYYTANRSRAALVFGNEVEGLSDAILPLLDDCIEIPQYGTKHSLNISVCAGIVLWEFSKVHYFQP